MNLFAAKKESNFAQNVGRWYFSSKSNRTFTSQTQINISFIEFIRPVFAFCYLIVMTPISDLQDACNNPKIIVELTTEGSTNYTNTVLVVDTLDLFIRANKQFYQCIKG